MPNIISVLLIAVLMVAATLSPFYYLSYSKKQLSHLYKFRHKIIYPILGLLLTIFYSLVIYKIFHYFTLHKEHTKIESAMDALVHHFDFTGIITGIVGIMVGLITVVLVEKNNDKKEENSRINFERSKEILDNLINNFGDISSHIKTLNDIRTLEDRFNAIKDIVKHASINNNELYISGYSANYSQILLYNINYIRKINNKSLDDLKKTRYIDFYKEIYGSKNELKESSFNSLEEFAKQGGTIKYVILSPNEENGFNKFKHFVKKRIMKGKNIIFYDKENHDLLSNSEITSIDENSLKDYFFYPMSRRDYNEMKGLGNNEKENLFVEEIVEANQNCIKILTDAASKSEKGNNVSFYYYDYIPFQFFLSSPKDDTNSAAKWQALIIFTNYYDLGHEHCVTSFSTSNTEFNKGLKNLFNMLRLQQISLNKNEHSLRKIFKQSKKIKLALKEVEVEEIEDLLGVSQATAVQDVLGKDYLLDLLKEYNILTDIQAVYINQKNQLLYDISKFDNAYTYFSLGLFAHPLAVRLGNGSLNSSRFYKLEPKSSKDTKNVALLTIGGTLSEPIQSSLNEVFNASDVKGSNDYAIFSRFTIDDRLYFVAGGINYFGSQHIAECLQDHCERINELAGNNEFIAIFKLYGNGEKSSLLGVTTLEDNKFIYNKVNEDELIIV